MRVRASRMGRVRNLETFAKIPDIVCKDFSGRVAPYLFGLHDVRKGSRHMRAKQWIRMVRRKVPFDGSSHELRTGLIALLVLVAVVAAVSVFACQPSTAFELTKADASSSQVAASAGSDAAARGSSGATSSDGASTSSSSAAEGEIEGAESTASEARTSIQVHVAGAVVNPGVYVLKEGDRVHDAVDAAGGCASDADSDRVNLAAPITDGEQVYIPRQGEADGQAAGASASVSTGSVSASTGAGQTSNTGTVKVNINTATSEQLQTLPGVGQATAQAIIDERTNNGPFTSTEDIQRVSGIGEKKYAKIKDYIYV